MKGWAALLAVAGLLALPAAAQQAAAARVEIPIKEVVLSDGTPRYGLPLKIGGSEVLAGIDTGAAGLRVLPDALKPGDAAPEAASEAYRFGSGAQLHGSRGTATVTVGGRPAPAALHLVTKVDCEAAKPRCPGSLGLGYGFLGNGLRGEGFRALLGGNMGRTSIDHPLVVTGARRWIIEVPRPGEGGVGRLIVNPTNEEVSGFKQVRLAGQFREADGGGLHDAVPGCLRNETTGENVCGLFTLDTGAFFIRVLNADRFAKGPWAKGAPMTLEIRGDQGTAATARMVVGGKGGQAVAFGRAPRPEVIVQLGTAPYLSHAVLYDPVGRRLGFKARPPIEGFPKAG